MLTFLHQFEDLGISWIHHFSPSFFRYTRWIIKIKSIRLDEAIFLKNIKFKKSYCFKDEYENVFGKYETDEDIDEPLKGA